MLHVLLRGQNLTSKGWKSCGVLLSSSNPSSFVWLWWTFQLYKQVPQAGTCLGKIAHTLNLAVDGVRVGAAGSLWWTKTRSDFRGGEPGWILQPKPNLDLVWNQNWNLKKKKKKKSKKITVDKIPLKNKKINHWKNFFFLKNLSKKTKLKKNSIDIHH